MWVKIGAKAKAKMKDRVEEFWQREECDTAAHADTGKLSAAIQRLGNEAIDLNMDWDVRCSKITNTQLPWFAGTFYGFKGTNAKCAVRVYVDSKAGEVRGFAYRGSQPLGIDSRYVYRFTLCGGTDLGLTQMAVTGLGGITISDCYTQTMLKGGTLRTPGGGTRPCADLASVE